MWFPSAKGAETSFALGYYLECPVAMGPCTGRSVHSIDPKITVDVEAEKSIGSDAPAANVSCPVEYHLYPNAVEVSESTVCALLCEVHSIYTLYDTGSYVEMELMSLFYAYTVHDIPETETNDRHEKSQGQSCYCDGCPAGYW